MHGDPNSGTLEKALIYTKRNQNNLFLAAEQGSGKFEIDVIVIINLKMKVEVWNRITEEYSQ